MISQNRAIRTNRTGGEFEREMDQRVREVDEKFDFEEPKTFSYHPGYRIQEMDVVWKAA